MENTKFSIKQGQSYTFSGELTDSGDNPINLSKFDKITVLVASPGYKVVRKLKNLTIKDNKLTFDLSAGETKIFEGQVIIEVELRRGNTVVIGTTTEQISIEKTKISKL
jgi:hypothetical protein